MEKEEIEGLGITYKVSGFYMYGGKKNFFLGEFNIDNNGRIQGKIQDPNSVCAEHLVEGSINFAKAKDNDNTKKITLNFVKISTGFFVNTYYTLAKTEKAFSHLIIGHYGGYWNFQEKVIPIIEGTESEIKNTARLTLEKI